MKDTKSLQSCLTHQAPRQASVIDEGVTAQINRLNIDTSDLKEVQ